MSATVSLEEVRVCAVDDVPLDEGRVVTVAGRPLALFHTAAGFFALDNTCPHMGGPLADGIVADETVACPLHDRRFRLDGGEAVGHDCGGVAAHPVAERDGEVLILVPRIEEGPSPGAGPTGEAPRNGRGPPPRTGGPVGPDVQTGFGRVSIDRAAPRS